MVSTKQEFEIYQADFHRHMRSATPSGAEWLGTLRESALREFDELGFPTTRHEEWKYTNVAPIATGNFRLPGEDKVRVDAGQLARFTFGDAELARIVIVDGRFVPELSSMETLPGGVTVQNLADAAAANSEVVRQHLAQHARANDHGFTALNTAFVGDGAFVHVPKGVSIQAPIHVLFVSTGRGQATVTYPRSLVVIEENAQAEIVESYVGLNDEKYLTNAVSELIVGDNAHLRHCRIQDESKHAYHVATLQVNQGRDSTLQSHSITLGAKLTRNNVEAVLDGEGGHCTLNGLFLVDGERHVDNHLRVDHARPHCDSREYYKGVLTDKGRGVFSGRILVRKDSQKTDAKQTNMNLLLSPDATIDTKPQLEIFADDVKCTHGATIGQLDADAIFYLRSRGMTEAAAKRLLVNAFAGEIIDEITIDPVRAHLETEVLRRLPRG